MFRVATSDEGSPANEGATPATVLATVTVGLERLDRGLSRLHLLSRRVVVHCHTNLCATVSTKPPDCGRICVLIVISVSSHTCQHSRFSE